MHTSDEHQIAPANLRGSMRLYDVRSLNGHTPYKVRTRSSGYEVWRIEYVCEDFFKSGTHRMPDLLRYMSHEYFIVCPYTLLVVDNFVRTVKESAKLYRYDSSASKYIEVQYAMITLH